MPAAPRRSPRERALLNADPQTGEVAASDQVTRDLISRGLAVTFGRLGHTYLTDEGRSARLALQQPAPEPEPPAPAPAAGTAGVFAARLGREAELADDGDQRRAEVTQAWHGLLELRGLAGDRSVPAQWEQLRPAWAVALALEAHGIAAATAHAKGTPASFGYLVNPKEQGQARVDWVGPSVSRARLEAEQQLTRCRAALQAAGWYVLQYTGPRGVRFLVVAPTPI